MESQIERILLNIDNMRDSIPLEEYKKEDDRYGRCCEALEECIKDDKEVNRLLHECYMASEALNDAMLIKYYREGFISGVKVALEVSGWKLPKD